MINVYSIINSVINNTKENLHEFKQLIYKVRA
jgi:hypothetical protein